MALAPLVPIAPSPAGNFLIGAVAVVGDNNYPTGGYPLAAITASKFTQVLAVFVRASPEFSASRLIRWNRASNTLQIYTALGTEAAGASDQSSTFATLTFIGR